jgi:hypothetical protein
MRAPAGRFPREPAGLLDVVALEPMRVAVPRQVYSRSQVEDGRALEGSSGQALFPTRSAESEGRGWRRQRTRERPADKARGTRYQRGKQNGHPVRDARPCRRAAGYGQTAGAETPIVVLVEPSVTVTT